MESLKYVKFATISVFWKFSGHFYGAFEVLVDENATNQVYLQNLKDRHFKREVINLNCFKLCFTFHFTCVRNLKKASQPCIKTLFIDVTEKKSLDRRT